MSSAKTVLSVCRSVGSVVLTILVALFSFLGVLSFALKTTVADEANYIAVAHDPAFSEQMMSYVREDLESECLFYDLPFTVLDEALSLEQIRTFSLEYVAGVYDSLLYGAELESPEWGAQPFITAVQHFFDSLPAEEKPFDETAAVTVGTELADCTAAFLKGGIRERFLEMGHRLFLHPLFGALLGKIPVFFLLAVVCVVGIFLCGWRKWKESVYASCFALSLSAFLAWVSFELLNRYDLMERIALADSPLKLYIESFYNSFLQEALSVTSFCLLITVVLFLVSIVLNCVTFRKKQ